MWTHRRSSCRYRGLWLAAALVLQACQGRPEAEIRADIQAEVQRINACGTVDDCQQVNLLCDSAFISRNADRRRFDELVQELRGSAGEIACPAICKCGVVSCAAGRCAVRSGDCMSVGPDERQTCL